MSGAGERHERETVTYRADGVTFTRCAWCSEPWPCRAALLPLADALAEAAEAMRAGAQTSLVVVTQARPDLGLPGMEEHWFTVRGILLDALNAALLAYRAGSAPAGVRRAEYAGGDPT